MSQLFEVFTVDEAGEVLGVGRGNTLASLIARGVIEPVIVDGREYISRASLERLASEGEKPKKPRRRERARFDEATSIADLDTDRDGPISVV